MTAEQENQCELIIKNLLELQARVGHYNDRQYKMLAEYLQPIAIDKPAFEYRLERSYGGYIFNRAVKIVNAEYDMLKPQKQEIENV